MNDVFLSYDQKDVGVAKAFAAAFMREGLSVWCESDVCMDAAYNRATEAALRGARAVVVLWSRRSVTSREVRSEATIADRNKTLVPVMIEPCERPVMFELTQTAELSHWNGDAGDSVWLSFLSDVQHRVSGKGPQKEPNTLNASPVESQVKVAPNCIPIVILPFVDMTAGKGHADFIAGLRGEVEIAVASLENYASIHFDPKADARNPVEIAKALGVHYVLDGSVRGVGGRLRVAANIVGAAQAEQIWNENFDGTTQEGFDLQDKVASTVAAQLEASVLRAEVIRISALPKQNLTAFQYHLLARAASQIVDRPSLETALSLGEQAVLLDPKLGVAHALVGWCHALMYQSGWCGNPAEAKRLGLSHLQQAIQIDENNFETLLIFATAHCCLGDDLSPANAMLDRAVRLRPEDPSLLRASGWVKVLIGKQKAAALDLFAHSLRLDSSSRRVAFTLLGQAIGDFVFQRFDLALRLAREVISHRPDYGLAHAIYVAALAHDGQVDRARNALKAMPPETPYDILLDVLRDKSDRALLRSGLMLAGLTLESTRLAHHKVS